MTTPLPPADPSWPRDASAYTHFAESTPLPVTQFRSYLAHAAPLPSAYIEEINENSPPSPLDNTSIDWSLHSSAFTALPSSLSTTDKPFIFDSGATCHISPERSDFLTFCPISSHPVAGLGGSSVYAVGCRSVELIMSDGQKLVLNDVLFIPSSDVHLISVHALNAAGNFVSHFDTLSCWVTDRSDNVVARSYVLPARNLYAFPSSSPHVSRSLSGSHSALLARRVPTVTSWHIRLGHLNQAAIVDMARSKVVQGMPINLSTSPPKCDPCIIGKQTRSSVPKVREGVRATRPLEHGFLDLCGPMSFMSRSGYLYSMNIIDDFSNYIWTVPLRTKSEALIAFQGWHAKVKNQSGYRLTYLVTDNGELSSHAMTSFCSLHGITHLFTAPYTSAHNGKAERLYLRRPDKSEPVPSATITWAERMPYRSLIGCLNYLAMGTRPDIAYAVGRLAGFLDCYRVEHWEAAICVVRYLKGTCQLCLKLGGGG